jgi:hypothetical protein
MSLYIKYNNQSLNEDDSNTDQAYLLLQSEYFKKKIKQLFFTIIPELLHASKRILKFCFFIISEAAKKIFYELINNKSDNIKKITNSFFKELHDFLKNSFQQLSNIVTVNLKEDKRAFFNMNEKEIIEFLKSQNMDDKKNNIIINANDMTQLQKVCEISTTKMFAIENANNYLCLPMTDENDNVSQFKAVKLTMYYKSAENVNNEQFNELVDYTNSFIKETEDLIQNKQNLEFKLKTFNGTKLLFKYYSPTEAKTLDYMARYDPSSKTIEVVFSDKDLNTVSNDFNHYYLTTLSSLIHEGLHDIDNIENEKFFTNKDFERFLYWLFDNYENKSTISVYEIKKDLKKKNFNNEEVIKYLLSLADRKGFIKFTNNFKDVQLLLDKNLLKIAQETLHDVLPLEELTQLSDFSFSFIEQKIKEINQIINNAINKKIKKDEFIKIIKKFILKEKNVDILQRLSFDFASSVQQERKNEFTGSNDDLDLSLSENIFEKLKEVIVKNITLIYERALNKKIKLKPKIKIKNVELEKE